MFFENVRYIDDVSFKDAFIMSVVYSSDAEKIKQVRLLWMKKQIKRQKEDEMDDILNAAFLYAQYKGIEEVVEVCSPYDNGGTSFTHVFQALLNFEEFAIFMELEHILDTSIIVSNASRRTMQFMVDYFRYTGKIHNSEVQADISLSAIMSNQMEFFDKKYCKEVRFTWNAYPDVDILKLLLSNGNSRRISEDWLLAHPTIFIESLFLCDKHLTKEQIMYAAARHKDIGLLEKIKATYQTILELDTVLTKSQGNKDIVFWFIDNGFIQDSTSIQGFAYSDVINAAQQHIATLKLGSIN